MRLIFSIIVSSLKQIFGMIASVLACFLFMEFAIAFIVFLGSGNLEFNLDNYYYPNVLLLNITPSNWVIDTNLVGFDKIVNSFINLQHDLGGRVKMLFISLASCVLFIFVISIFDLEDMNKSSQKPGDITFFSIIFLIVGWAAVFPYTIAVLVFIFEMIFSIF